MGLSSIQPDRSLQPQTPREPPLRVKTPETEPFAPETAPASDVKLGGELAASQLKQILAERVLSRIEAELAPPVRDMFLAAGKAEFETSLAIAPDDASPETVANKIVEGVTGYIFRAFQAQHPQMTREDFLGFQEQVLRGFEAGVEDAKDILTGLRVMNPDLEASIEQTRSLAREQLDRFFEEAATEVPEPTAA